MTSDWAHFIWLLGFAILVRASLTLYHVPHLALGAEMAEDYHQRSTLYAMSTFFGFFGWGAVCSGFLHLVFPNNGRLQSRIAQ